MNYDDKTQSQVSKDKVTSKLFTNLRNKSLDTKPIKVTSRKKIHGKKEVFNKFKIISAALYTAAIIAPGVFFANYIKEEQSLQLFYTSANNIVSDNTHRAENPGNYWYDYRGIAEGLAEAEGDFDINLFGVFNHVGWNESSKIDQMDKVIDECHQLGLTECSDFQSYCQSKGYCDENNNMDLNAYRKSMKEYLKNIQKQQELETNNEGFKPGL